MATTKTNVPAKQEDRPKSSLVLAEGLDLSFVEGDSGHGVDEMSMADIAMPYIYILQANSPVVNPAASAFVEGAAASMFYNNVSLEVYDGRKEGLVFVPCHYERKYVEWVDRDKGGGWVRDYDADSDIMRHMVKNEKGKPILRDSGNNIVETAYHYGLMYHLDDEEWQNCVMPLKSTALKANKRLNNELVTAKIPGSSLVAPRWLFPYRVTTVPESKGGNNWWSPRFERLDETVSKSVYVKAKEFADMLKSGLIQRGAEPGVGSAVDGPDGGDVPF